MADDDLGGLFAMEEAERILLNEARRPKPPADDEAEVFAHWWPLPSGNVWCDRCEILAAEWCACWADMMARRAAAEDAADMREENDRG